jgi:hypothetical protein
MWPEYFGILAGSLVLRLANTRVKYRTIHKIQLHYHRAITGVEKKKSQQEGQV